MNNLHLRKYLWGAATKLRGKIDAGDYKQYIFPLLFYKRICDVYDEEYQDALKKSSGDKEFAKFKENHRFQIPEKYHWDKLRETTQDVGIFLLKAMKSIENANLSSLSGIFGDASWSNKDRLTDETLIDLIDHFSNYKLNISNVPDDQLGNAYEYLIKQFADDSGHTAAEFYTNRSVVELMTKIVAPKPGESIYDPTCGSGGLLLNCALQIKKENKEYRSLKLYGQEINLLTSSIARMNMFLHNIEEFNIVRGDTLSNPAFIENDKIRKFDVVLANPPYSIKSWDQNAFQNDFYGRNIWGTPPKKCADYAFQQHIQKSLKNKSGRSVSLWPHGILFRESEAKIRYEMIKNDFIECIIGLGPNLFYNSPMESCLLITKNTKPSKTKGKILIINAVNEVRQQKNLAILDNEHINKILKCYQEFKDINNFSKIISIQDALDNKGSLNIAKYVSNVKNTKVELNLNDTINNWQQNSLEIKSKMNNLLSDL